MIEDPENEYGVDPYGCAIADIKAAITKALSVEAAMNWAERANLVSVEEFVRVVDNS